MKPTQDTPADLVNDLMQAVRSGFYENAGDQWFKDQAFLRRNVVLWPAGFVVGKGFSMTPERYKGVMLEIFQDIKRHGKTGAVKFWPGYLMKCVQDHFKIHWDEYYQEAKSLRMKLDQAMFAARSATEAQRGPDLVESMAAAHSALKAAKKAKQKPASDLQKSLF